MDSDYDLDDDEAGKFEPGTLNECEECLFVFYTEDDSRVCEGCTALGEAPPMCLTNDCEGAMVWQEGRPLVAACRDCDTEFHVKTLRTIRLGQLVERIVLDHSKKEVR